MLLKLNKELFWKNKEVKNKIEKFLLDYKLTAEENILAVGFSGGYDSMALLDILKKLSDKYKFKIIAAHLNHNWRNEESRAEAVNCENFCKKNNIKFYTETLDVNEKHTETRARELRYQFFNRVIDKFSVTALMTAHTKSDTAETLIYRLIKGTGIKGLQGIAPILGKIYRPMLDISRNEVENYCAKNNLIPNDDSSNKNPKYSRNFIRNKVIPLFKEINPQVENSVNSLSILAYEEEQIIGEYINSLNLYDGDKIKSEVFKKLSLNLQKRLIYEIYVVNDFEYTQERVKNVLDFVLKNIDSKSGKKCSIDSKHWLFVSDKYIKVIKITNKNSDEIYICKEGEYNYGNYIFTIEKCENMPKTYPPDSEYKAYVELNDIDFVLRTRKNGDKFKPLGSEGLTKLKKYFINKNIPQHEKDSIILLCKDDEILWVSGYAISDKIKVVNNCTHVLTLKKIGGT